MTYFFRRNYIPVIKLLALIIFIFTGTSAFSQATYISAESKSGFFPLVSATGATEIFVDPNDHKGVLRVAEDLQKDIERVTGKLPALNKNTQPGTKVALIAGTFGNSKLIDQLVKSKKLDVSNLQGKWETFSISTVNNPFPGVERALVIAGSDKRGTIFGMYDVSEEIGVSPWYFWADVPVKKKNEIHVQPGSHSKGTPKVKYRGIFINDEAPALAGWATENFDGFTSGFYEHVFELILRMKGNYLWPAMWGRAFYDDDPKNPVLADEYGVVIGTSHHEPLMRAHDEWRRFGEGEWDYTKNKENLQKFWRNGVERTGDYESVLTLGMRGDGDEPMTEGTAISLLETIVADQRKIIADVTGKPAKETPQVWALYKEVQDYYDQGMRVPDDVTLLLADDNWGNIRKLPNPEDEPREGGYGIYYHFDYVGGPRNYKWINTTQIARVWEQMNLAYEFGADRLWIVNVGDIKPMEYPTSFFLDQAWDPEAFKAEDLAGYPAYWAEKQFGKEHAKEIGEMLEQYTQFTSRKKPELLSPETYSITNYNEAENVLKEYRELVERAEEINKKIPAEYRDAYFQIVLFPVKASANLHELYIATAKNRLYASQQRASTNQYAEKVRELFQKDIDLTEDYHQLGDGKWNHMMSQTHIGYTYWQQPEENVMPEVNEIKVPEKAGMGIAVEGSEATWPAKSPAELPTFDPWNDQEFYVEILNKGRNSFTYKIENKNPWVKVSKSSGTVKDQDKILVNIDWEKAPAGEQVAQLNIKGSDGTTISVDVPVNNRRSADIKGFVESNGYISMEAGNFAENVRSGENGWKEIPNLGKNRAALAPFPATLQNEDLGEKGPHLVYHFHSFSEGKAEIEFLVSPTLDFKNSGGLQFAFSIDGKEPQRLNIHQNTKDNWGSSVSNYIKRVTTEIDLKSGNHTLRIWPIDPGVVLQKIVIKTGEVKPSYLGPPESGRK